MLIHAFTYRFAGAAALLTLFFTGCGKSDSVERLPVAPLQGEVQWDGRPLPGALVVFHPAFLTENPPPPARATVQEDGVFHLTTYDAGDGVLPGDYKVTVEWRPLVRNGDEVKAGPNHLPAKYSHPETTDLQVKVAEGTTRLPPLQLRR